MDPSMQPIFKNVFFPTLFLFREHALKSEVPSRFFALCNFLGPPCLKRFIKLFPGIYDRSIPEFFGHHESNPVDF